MSNHISKYPRTFHLSWSKGASNDDKIATSVDSLIGQPIVITEKIDGGNASIELNGVFARTHAGAPSHPSFDHLKAFHSTIKYKLENHVQLFGENCFAKHSIAYDALPGYFLLFNVRYLNPIMPLWASWDEVEMWAEEIGVPTVPVLFKGQVKNENELKELTESFMDQPSACGGIREGVVARLAKGFTDSNFSSCVFKLVRANHVQTSEHWSAHEIIKNKLKA